MTINVEKIVDESENFIDDSLAVAALLIDGWLFCNRDQIFLLCSDTFVYACADGEPVFTNDNELDSEFGALFLEWKRNNKYGPLKWIAKKRGVQPLSQIVEKMKAEGVWDSEMEKLNKN
jgi:hypothetical protein